MTILENEENFLKEVEKNLTNKEDIKNIKNIFEKFIKFSLKEMNNNLQIAENKIKTLENKMKDMEKIEEKLNNLEKDISTNKGYDFEIMCPYCDTDFIVDIENEEDDIICPNCKKTIELDWSGSLEDDLFACSGSCNRL